jgi:hypothetical protein
MSNIEDKLKLAARITALRSELLRLETEFAGPPVSKPRAGGPHGKGRAEPSIAARVLNVVREAGSIGISRRDILAVIPHDSAVHSALKVHAAAGRIHSDSGQWVYGPVRSTRELRVPVEAFADHQ